MNSNWPRVSNKLLRHLLVLVTGSTTLILGIVDHYSPEMRQLFQKLDYVDPFPIVDSAFFQHAGWYITLGARPYVHFWDVKPPFAAFEIPTLIAYLAGSNMYMNQILHIILMSLITLGTFHLTAELISKLSGSELTGPLIGCFSLLTFTAFYVQPIKGLRPKAVMLFFGVLALYLMIEKRFFWAGFSSGFALGSWQLGILFPIVVMVEGYRSEPSEDFFKSNVGFLLSLILILIPIIYWDSFSSMVLEVFLAPMLTEGKLGLGNSPLYAVELLELSVLVSVSGIISAIILTYNFPLKFWWITFGLCFYLIQVLFLDLDNTPDLIPLVFFTSLPFALFARRLSYYSRIYLALFLLILIPLNAFGIQISNNFRLGTGQLSFSRIGSTIHHGHLSIGPTRTNLTSSKSRDVTDFSFSEVYWNKIISKRCHYRLSQKEKNWMKLVDCPEGERICGLPDRRIERKLGEYPLLSVIF